MITVYRHKIGDKSTLESIRLEGCNIYNDKGQPIAEIDSCIYSEFTPRNDGMSRRSPAVKITTGGYSYYKSKPEFK
jgi:hypothetical protein